MATKENTNNYIAENSAKMQICYLLSIYNQSENDRVEY